MLSDYANQSITWKRRTGQDDRGTPRYEEPAVIRGRFQHKRRMIRNANGEEVVSEAFVMTEAHVRTGDILGWDGRDWPVVSVSTVPGLMGEELHREVYL